MVMESLASGFSSWLFDMVMWVFIVVAIASGGWWWYINKLLYKYTFIEWFDHKTFRVIKGKIIKTKKGIKKFALRKYSDPTLYLPITEPNGFFNGKPTRHITWDGMGSLTYLEGVKVSKDKYLETALTPVERTEAIDAQMESAEKGISMDTMSKWALGTVVVICVFLMITIVMVAKYGFEQAGTITGATTNLIKASELQQETQNVIKHNTIAMNNLAESYAVMFNLSINQELGTG